MDSLELQLNGALVGFSNILLRHVMPLFIQPKGKRPVILGTGFLVQHNDASFLVSAAHVLDYTKPPGALYYYTEATKVSMVSGTVLCTPAPEGNRARDRLDVGIVRLNESPLPPFHGVDKYPISFELLRESVLTRTSKQYLVNGFPKSQSHANPVNKQFKLMPYGFRSISADPSQYKHLKLSDSSHIVMPLDASEMSFPDGQVRPMPDPHGMSGSPLWLLYDSIGPNNPIATPVVGVVIEYHKAQKVLVATDIGCVKHLIMSL